MASRYPVTYADPVRTALDIVVDIPLAELEKDPYPFYVWMREECPVAYVPETGRVWNTTWELCKAAGVSDTVFGPSSAASEDVYGGGNVMTLTGEEHRVLRSAANAPVRRKRVQSYYETGIRATAKRYLAQIRARGTADATLEIFEPICQRVVGDVLGFADVDDETLGRWFHALGGLFVDYGREPQVAERGRQVKVEVREFLEHKVPQLIAEPDHTALSHLLRDGMPDGRFRTIDEIVPTVHVLIVGGFQEPAHLVASTLYGLLINPGQMRQVLAEPATWVRAAVEEGLRWLSPFGMTEKRTTRDVTIGGVLIPAETEIALVIGSANRDPEHFGRPDDFDIDRGDQDNVSFGFGRHFCIGHHLSRALGEVVLAETLEALPNLRLDPDRPAVVQGWTMRAPKPLPVNWDA
ncbi:MAG: cytochrome P450 [Streptomyces sp.]|jgi:cytochrome P450|nr:cytochrome P450 [Streptomyces sp.]